MRVIMSQIGVFFAYFPGAIWTIQHLTVTLTFKDHWSRDLHDLAERRLNIITIRKFQDEFWGIERQLV